MCTHTSAACLRTLFPCTNQMIIILIHTVRYTSAVPSCQGGCPASEVRDGKV